MISRSQSVLAKLALHTPQLLTPTYAFERIVALRNTCANLQPLPAGSANWRFCEAVYNGREDEALGLMFESDFRHDAQDEVGLYPLHVAAQAGMESLVGELLSRGAEVDATALSGETALTYTIACNAGVTAATPAPDTSFQRIVAKLIAAKADVDMADGLGLSPLIHAAWAGDAALMVQLRNAGADLHAADCVGCDALDYAARYLRFAACQQLLSWGVDPRPFSQDIPSPREKVERLYGRRQRATDVLAIRQLLAKSEIIAMAHASQNLPVWGVDLTQIAGPLDTYRGLAHHFKQGNDLLLTEMSCELVSVLAGFKDPPESAKADHELLKASLNGYDSDVARAYEKGASPHVRDKYGRTPLIISAQQGFDHLFPIHLKYKPDLEAKEMFGHTALMEIVKELKEEGMMRLLMAGANPLARNWCGLTALQLGLIESVMPFDDSHLESPASPLQPEDGGPIAYTPDWPGMLHILHRVEQDHLTRKRREAEASRQVIISANTPKYMS